MIFSDLYNEVKTNYPDADISTANAKKYVNRAYRQIALTYSFYESEGTSSFNTVADQSAYAVATVAAGARDIISIRDTTNKYNLKPETIQWYNEQDVSTDVSSQPLYYVRHGANILLWPLPDAVYAMLVRHRTLPADLSADGDTPKFPEPWHEVLAMLASAKAGIAAGFGDIGQNFKNEALGLIGSIQEDTTMEARRRIGQISIQRTRRTARESAIRRLHAEFDV
jgi:hypothetical protein